MYWSVDRLVRDDVGSTELAEAFDFDREEFSIAEWCSGRRPVPTIRRFSHLRPKALLPPVGLYEAPERALGVLGLEGHVGLFHVLLSRTRRIVWEPTWCSRARAASVSPLAARRLIPSTCGRVSFARLPRSPDGSVPCSTFLALLLAGDSQERFSGLLSSRVPFRWLASWPSGHGPLNAARTNRCT